MTAANKSELTEKSQADLYRFLELSGGEAGQRYLEIQSRLIKMFEFRGSKEPEELAWKTIVRVANKCGTLLDSYVGDPAHYFVGVARRVFLESVRKSPPPLVMPEPDPPEVKEVRQACLEQCLEELSRRNRELILEYYSAEGGQKRKVRQRLARRFDKTPNALRILAHRIRKYLQRCVLEQLEKFDIE